MPSLLELQNGFSAALFDGHGGDDRFLNCLVEAHDVARQRLAAYRRSVMGRWMDAIEASYPVVTALVGRPFLREAARQYAAGHPSNSGDLNEYGESFGDFLDGYPYAAHLPYLGDVARLEWQVQAVALGLDTAPMALGQLGLVAPADWPRLVLGFVPNLARIDSRWSIAEIWRLHQTTGAELRSIELNAGCRVLIWREGHRPVVLALSAAQAALFDALHAGVPLGRSLTQAASLQPDFDPGPFLQGLAQSGLLCSAEVQKDT